MFFSRGNASSSLTSRHRPPLSVVLKRLSPPPRARAVRGGPALHRPPLHPLLLHPAFLHPAPPAPASVSPALGPFHPPSLHPSPCIPRSCIRSPPRPPPLRLLHRPRPAAAQRRAGSGGAPWPSAGPEEAAWRRISPPSGARCAARSSASAGGCGRRTGRSRRTWRPTRMIATTGTAGRGSGRDRGREGGWVPRITREAPGWAPGSRSRPWGCSALGMCSGSASRSDSPTPLFLPSPVNALTGNFHLRPSVPLSRGVCSRGSRETILE